MPEIDGVNIVPHDEVAELKAERDELKRHNAGLSRKLGRVTRVARELRTVAPAAAVLIEGALER